MEALLKRLAEIAPDCGDNSCKFSASKGGMRTNGGCRCLTERSWVKAPKIEQYAYIAKTVIDRLLEEKAKLIKDHAADREMFLNEHDENVRLHTQVEDLQSKLEGEPFDAEKLVKENIARAQRGHMPDTPAKTGIEELAKILDASGVTLRIVRAKKDNKS